MPYRIFGALLLLLTSAISTSAHGGAVMIPMIVPVQAYMPTQTGNYSAIHTVAIISGIGQSMTIQNNHFFSPKSKDIGIAGWKIDDEASALIQHYLGTRFEFKDIAYDRAALARIPNGPMDNILSGFQGYVRALPNPGVDAYVVVRPDLEENAPGLAGLSLVTNGDDGLPVVWANYEIDIINARTFGTIARTYSRVRLRKGEPAAFAGIVTGPELKTGDDLALTAAQSDLLQKVVSKTVELSMIETLRALNLGVPLPDSGARTLVPIPPGKTPYPSIKSVAIISAVGDQLSFIHRGAMFARGAYALPIAQWGMDQLVSDAVRAALTPALTVKPESFDQQTVYGASLLNTDGKLEPSFPGLKPAQDVDAYLVILKFPRPMGMLNVPCPGLGLWNQTGINLEETDLYAHYAIALIDARTLKVIAAHAATMPP
ncbi:MAG TPA: hypothetical protein VH000_07590, partial [Rhizomicrobium sp.]|nr:hypothetical protein [Rhizomicrobium sp.]